MKKIIFTGGHHNSALELAKALKKQKHQIHWLGHKFTISGHKSLSAEYQEVTDASIPFHELKAGKFYRLKNPLQIIKIIFGFFQALIYLIQIRPNLIISFGGYMSVPVVIIGWFLRIPSVTHEQTVTAGWANKAISPFVKKIFLTHPSALPNYPASKSVVTGLPLRPGFLKQTTYKHPKPPLIYVTCGKQGSHIINQALFPIIPELVKNYQIVHQTGAHSTTNDKKQAGQVRQSLPDSLKSRYQHQEYFFAKQAIRYYQTAGLTVSRAGAHTVYELLHLNKPCLVIPIPWVSHNEQAKNAQLLTKQGNGLVLPQKQLTPQSLHKFIKKGLKIKPSPPKNPVILNATERIIKQLQPFLHDSHSKN